MRHCHEEGGTTSSNSQKETEVAGSSHAMTREDKIWRSNNKFLHSSTSAKIGDQTLNTSKWPTEKCRLELSLIGSGPKTSLPTKVAGSTTRRRANGRIMRWSSEAKNEDDFALSLNERTDGQGDEIKSPRNESNISGNTFSAGSMTLDSEPSVITMSPLGQQKFEQYLRWDGHTRPRRGYGGGMSQSELLNEGALISRITDITEFESPRNTPLTILESQCTPEPFERTGFSVKSPTRYFGDSNMLTHRLNRLDEEHRIDDLLMAPSALRSQTDSLMPIKQHSTQGSPKSTTSWDGVYHRSVASSHHSLMDFLTEVNNATPKQLTLENVIEEDTHSSTVKKEGWLWKESRNRKTWNERLFRLEAGGFLRYYDSKNKRVCKDTISLVDANLVERKIQKFKDYWKDGSYCELCTLAFSTFRRKHHCRSCGSILCGKCSEHRIPIPKKGLVKPERVCKRCWDDLITDNMVTIKTTSKPMVENLESEASLASCSSEPAKEDDQFTVVKRNDIVSKARDVLTDTSYMKNQFGLKIVGRQILWLAHKKIEEKNSWVDNLRAVINNLRDESLDAKTQYAEIDFENLHFGPVIASGAYGEVYTGTLWGTKVAIKKMKPDSNITNVELEDFRNEIDLLSTLRHPNIVLFLGASTGSDICIVTEWCEKKSLYDVIHDEQIVLSLSCMLDIMIGIGMGLNYLHSLPEPIIHRDLKSLNVLIQGNQYRPKVADFGVSGFANKVQMGEGKKIFGTPAWISPEMLLESSYTFSTDVYSYGIILTEILSRRQPYEEVLLNITGEEPSNAALEKIREFVLKGGRPPIPVAFRRLLGKIVDKCLDSDPSARPPFSDLLVKLSEIQSKTNYELFVADVPKILEFINCLEGTRFQRWGALQLLSMPDRSPVIGENLVTLRDFPVESLEKLILSVKKRCIICNENETKNVLASLVLRFLNTKEHREQVQEIIEQSGGVMNFLSLLPKAEVTEDGSKSLRVTVSEILKAYSTKDDFFCSGLDVAQLTTLKEIVDLQIQEMKDDLERKKAQLTEKINFGQNVQQLMELNEKRRQGSSYLVKPILKGGNRRRSKRRKRKTPAIKS